MWFQNDTGLQWQKVRRILINRFIQLLLKDYLWGENILKDSK